MLCWREWGETITEEVEKGCVGVVVVVLVGGRVSLMYWRARGEGCADV